MFFLKKPPFRWLFAGAGRANVAVLLAECFARVRADRIFLGRIIKANRGIYSGLAGIIFKVDRKVIATHGCDAAIDLGARVATGGAAKVGRPVAFYVEFELAKGVGGATNWCFPNVVFN